MHEKSAKDRPALESPEASPRVAIVILTINQRETTERVLQSFGAAIERWSFLVWDNGSEDGTATNGADDGMVVADAPGVPLAGARAEGGPNMTVAGDVTILATTVADANTYASASQLGALISRYTDDD